MSTTTVDSTNNKTYSASEGVFESPLFALFSIKTDEDGQKFLELKHPKLGVVRSRIPIMGDEIIMPSGSTPIFRQIITVDELEIPKKDPKGVVIGYEKVLQPRVIATIEEYILGVVGDGKVSGHIRRIIAKNSKEEAEILLRSLVHKALNNLYKPTSEWTAPGTDFESLCQKNTFVLSEDRLPIPRGAFAADIEVMRRMSVFNALVEAGLGRYAATQPGNPGMTADKVDKFKYTAYMRIQPLAHFCHPMRFSIQRGLSHMLPIIGDRPSYVSIKRIGKVRPPMANLNVACMDMNLDDSVIISEVAAKKLTCFHDVMHKHDIDSLITCRGGISFKGRKGAPVQKTYKKHCYKVTRYGADTLVQPYEFEMPENVKLTEFGDGTVAEQQNIVPKFDYMQILMELRREWLALYSNGDDASFEQMYAWKLWLADNDAWKECKRYWNPLNQPVIRKFASAGMRRMVSTGLSGSVALYEEYKGVEVVEPSDGMKIQSEADLFKGTAVILPYDRMPIIKHVYADGSVEYVRADVVCDMAKSTKKHGSLKFAHLTIVLNKIAKCVTAKTGEPFVVSHDEPLTCEEIVAQAQEFGGYEDDSLTCDILEPSALVKIAAGKSPVILGRYAAGIVRVGRHRQHAEVQGGVVGYLPDDTSYLRDCLKSSGKKDGFIDTMIQISCGYTELAKELRSVDPASEAELEILRSMVVFADDVVPSAPNVPATGKTMSSELERIRTEATSSTTASVA